MKYLSRLRITFLTFIIMFPFLVLTFMSFTKSWFYPSLFPKVWTWEAWQFVLSDEDFLMLMLKSSALSVSVALISTILAFFVTRQLYLFRFDQRIYSVAYLPYSFSPVIYAFCIQFMFIQIGLRGSYFGVFIAQLLISFPYSVLLFSKHWGNKMRNLEAVSLSLGASSTQTFLLITLPVSIRIIGLSIIQSFLISWFDYGLSWVIGAGSVNTITLKIYQYISESNLAFASMASLVLLLPPTVVVIIQNKIWNRYVA